MKHTHTLTNLAHHFAMFTENGDPGIGVPETLSAVMNECTTVSFILQRRESM